MEGEKPWAGLEPCNPGTGYQYHVPRDSLMAQGQFPPVSFELGNNYKLKITYMPSKERENLCEMLPNKKELSAPELLTALGCTDLKQESWQR